MRQLNFHNNNNNKQSETGTESRSYWDGVLLGIQDLHVHLHILVCSLGALVEQPVQQSEVDVVANIV